MKSRSILLLGMLLIILTGCTPWVQAVQTSQTDLVALDQNQTVGQSFVARYDGLQAVQIYLSPMQPGEGEITLRLQTEVGSAQDVGKAILPFDQVTEAKTYRFDFPALENSNDQYYYALLEIDGAGSLGVEASAGNPYQDGALYQQGLPEDGQLNFSLVYDPLDLAIGLADELIRWTGLLILGGLLYLVPGWAVLGWRWRGWGLLSWAEKAGLSAGVSLTLYAVLILLTNLVGVHLGAWYAWGLIIPGLGGMLWRLFKRGDLKASVQLVEQAIRQPFKTLANRLPDTALVILIGLIFITRWWAIREIEAPMWGDSVQHTFITQLILDHGGLFQSWEPYTPYSTFSNQFGFPAAAALLAWVSGSEATQAVLWAGQILNGLAVLALYPIAVRLAQGQRWAGVGAVLAAGLVSTMPAFYFNWGRYAQLAGQVILPTALWMLWEVVEDLPTAQHERGIRTLPWEKIILAGMVLGGMVMYQYRTPFYYLTFILAWVVGWWLPAWRMDVRRWLRAGMVIGLVVVVGMLIFLPWGIIIMTSEVGELAAPIGAKVNLLENLRANYQSWNEFFDYVPPLVAFVALAGWLWGLIRRNWPVFAVGVWILWLASIYSWIILDVPGAHQVSSFAVLISLYIPTALLFGWFVGRIGRALQPHKAVEACLLLILVGLSVWFTWQQRTIAEPQTFAMVTRPDLRAMTWIRENTDPEAIFLVEGFRAFYNTTAVGSDAGWWIPLLASRENTIPPLYALASEVPLEADYSMQVVELVEALETIPLSSKEGLDLLCTRGVTHVYIGQLQGLVGIAWMNQSYTAEEMLEQPLYKLIYHQDRVHIFALKPEACLGGVEQ